MASKTRVRGNQVVIEEILNDASAQATTTKKGTLRIATQAEVTAGTATDIAVTPATLDNWMFANDGVDFTVKPATNGTNAITIGHNSLSYDEGVAIGSGITAQTNSVSIGNTSDASGTSAVAIGHLAKASSNYQVSIGYNMPVGSPEYSVRIGYAQADANQNYFRLRNKGQFEIFGDEAQFVVPNYPAGSPGALPTNAIEGALVYDAAGNTLKLYDGASWADVGSGLGLFTEDGNNNIVGGTGAGASLTSGFSNFFAGYNAGGNVTTYQESVIIGHEAGSTSNLRYGTLIGVYAGQSLTNNQYGTMIGWKSGQYITTGSWNTAVGTQSLQATSAALTGTANVGIGHKSGYKLGSNSTDNIIIGGWSGFNLTTADDNVLIGRSAGLNLTTGSGNVALGNRAGGTTNESNKLYINNATSNTPLIGGSFANSVGSPLTGQVTVQGDFTVANTLTVTSGSTLSVSAVTNYENLVTNDDDIPNKKYVDDSIAIGGGAAYLDQLLDVTLTGSPAPQAGDTLIFTATGSPPQWVHGKASGLFVEDVDRNIIGGTGAGASLTTGTDNFVAGYATGDALDVGSKNVLIGNYAGTYMTSSAYNVVIGYKALDDNDTASADRQTIIGAYAGRNVSGGDAAGNIVLGFNAGRGAGLNGGTGGGNFFAGYNTATVWGAAHDNVAIGESALNVLVNGSSNIAIGKNAGSKIVSNVNNVLIGTSAGRNTTGDQNVFVGSYAGFRVTTGDRNHGFGRQALSRITVGTDNIGIGYNAGPTVDTSNKLFINIGESDTPLIGGDFGTDTVTINGDFDVSNTATGSPSRFSEIRLHDNVNNAVTVITNAPLTGSPTGDTRFQLPADNGQAGRFLQTDGSGNTSWQVAAGSISVLSDLSDVTLGSPVDNEILTYSGGVWINAAPSAGSNWLTANSGSNFVTAPTASGTNSIALGNNANATNTDGISIGTSIANNQASRSIAIGRQSSVTGTSSNNSIAFGYKASCSATNAIAIGQSSDATGSRDSVFGYHAYTTGSSVDCLVLGSICGSDNARQVVVGKELKPGQSGITEVADSAKLGTHSSVATRNFLYIHSKGKLELHGDEAQYVLPNYAGSPGGVPANAIEGGLIYDSLTSGLKVYTGSPGGWTDVGGAAGDPAMQLTWTFSQSTATAPGSGVMRWGSTTPAATAQMYINDTSLEGIDAGKIFADMTIGDQIYVKQLNDDTKYFFGTIDLESVDGTGWWYVNVAFDNGGSRPDEGATVGLIKMTGRSIGRDSLGNFIAGVGAAAGAGRNICIGDNAGSDMSSSLAFDNVIIGDNAGRSITSGDRNVIIGVDACGNAAVSGNARDHIFIGRQSGYDAVGSSYGSISIGRFSGRFESGFGNVMIGDYAGNQSTANTGSQSNVAIGRRTAGALTSGDNNVFVGLYSGQNISTGSNNVIIGNHAGPTTNQSDQLFIHSDTAASNTPLIHGDFATPAVTINGDLTVTGTFSGGGTSALHDLSDVQGTGSPTPSNGDVLTYVSGSPGYWTAAAGGSSNNWIDANNGSDFGVAPSAPQAGEFEIAMGDSAYANGGALGGALAVGSRSVGYFANGARATAGFATAIGTGAEASGQSSLALGASSTSSANGTISMLDGTASAAYGMAIGRASFARSADDIAIGQYTATGASGQRSIVIGRSSTTSTGIDNAIAIGIEHTVSQDKQNVIGNAITSADVTTDVAYSTKIGYAGATTAEKNLLHLFSKGKLELYGDEAQFILPNYAGSPGGVPANAIEGGLIYDSVAQGLLVYAGSPTGWTAVGGGSSNNWLTANNGSDFASAPSATGSNALALGNSASANNTSGIAVGNGASTSGNFGISIGTGSAAAYSIAIGRVTTSTGSSTIAIGDSSDATGTQSIAIGENAYSKGASSVSIGPNSDTGSAATGAVALGTVAQAYGTYSIAIGRNSNVAVGGSNSVVVGPGASAPSDSCTILGANNVASTFNQTIIGKDLTSADVTTDVAYSVKIGNGVTGVNTNILHLFSKGKLELYGDEAMYILPNYAGSPGGVPANAIEGGLIYDSVAQGLLVYGGSPTGWAAVGGGSSNNWLTANNGLDFGTAPTATGSNSIALGNNASAAATTNSVAIGTSTVSQASGVTIGDSSTGTGDSVTIGHAAKSTFTGSVSIGDTTHAYALQSIAIGNLANATYKFGVAIGNSLSSYGGVSIGNNSDSAYIGVAIGKNNTAAASTVAMGYSNNAASSFDVAIGRFSSTAASKGSSIAIGNNSDTAGVQAIAFGYNNNTADLTNQTAIGSRCDAGSVNTDVAYSVKLGYGLTGTDKNMLHLFSKGKLELYGDEAMFVMPNYVGSPAALPTNPVKGGVVFDTVSEGLKVYAGSPAGWTAVGGISNIVEDTTPQLGGDLDVNGYDIISADTTGGGISIGIKAGQSSYAGAYGTFNGHVDITTSHSIYNNFAGNINLTAGDAQTTTSYPGNINIEAGGRDVGAGGGGSPYKNTGSVNIKGGLGASTTADGGDVNITGGNNASSSAAAGDVNIAGGTNQSSGGHGNVNITGETITFTGVAELEAYNETAISYGTSGSIGLDTSSGTYFYPTGTTTGSITFSFNNPGAGSPTPPRVTTFALEMLGAGNNAPVWPGSVVWANGVEPTWTTGTDIVTFFTRDAGTTWYGSAVILNDATIDLNNADILNARSITFNSEVTVTPSGSPLTATADWTAGQKQKITITAATTLSFTAPAGQSNLTLKVINGGTGTITWPGTVKWSGGTEPSWTTTGTDIVSFYYDGTNYYGMAGLAFA